MSATETTAHETKRSPLDDVVVKKPDASNEKQRKYLCGIKAIPGMEHLDRVVGIGPATFGKRSYIWDGAGPDAKQIEILGVINVLTDRQVEEVRSKIRFRYLRPNFSKDGTLKGFKDVDSSDSGGILVDAATKVESVREPIELRGRTFAGDLPLKDFLTMDVVYEDSKVRGRVITLEEARAVVLAAEEEINRPLESVDATFELGRKAKASKKSDSKVDDLLESLSKSRPEISGAPSAETTSHGGSVKGASGKSVSGGAGRLPEK